MAVRPITFTGPMVSAILDGRKTQTRRVLKPQPAYVHRGVAYRSGERDDVCPIPHAVGDLLWVKETWAKVGDGPDDIHACPDIRCHAYYRVGSTNAEQQRWRSSRYMPRWASRITLRVTDVRVQRVQDISVDDVVAEGIDLEGEHSAAFSEAERVWSVGGSLCCRFPEIYPFRRLWDSINAKHGHGWEANPWVAAYTFEPIMKNVDEVVTDD